MQAKLAASGQAIREICECGAGFWRHRQARARLCCACRVEHSNRVVQVWKGRGGDPLPGYPRQTKFSTMEEIHDYVSREKVECLLCGRTFRGAAAHVWQFHQMSLREYKQLFGIPYNVGIVGDETSQLLSDAGTATVQGIGPERLAANLVAAVAKQKNMPRWDQIHGSLALLAMRRAGVRKAIQAPNRISNKTDKIPWPCNICGSITEVGECFTITNPCRVRCQNCRK